MACSPDLDSVTLAVKGNACRVKQLEAKVANAGEEEELLRTQHAAQLLVLSHTELEEGDELSCDGLAICKAAEAEGA